MVDRTFPKSPIALSDQVIVMKRHFPKFEARWRKNIVTWIGDLEPCPLSHRYRIKITHQLHCSPSVWVLMPKLTERNELKIPHLYPGNRLCLYHPQKREWNQQMYIATTIVPWTSLWLFYYEIWQSTGEWTGDGEHPDLTRRRKQTSISLLRHMAGKMDRTKTNQCEKNGTST